MTSSNTILLCYAIQNINKYELEGDRKERKRESEIKCAKKIETKQKLYSLLFSLCISSMLYFTKI
jgi:hypothetical protein